MERDWNYIKNSIQKIFYAEQDEKFLAGLRIGCFNSIAYTHQVINSYSSSGNVAGPLLTWNAIKWAKKSNFKFYDCSGGEKRPDDKTKQKKYSEQWDTLFAYKKKWGGDEYPYFHFTKVQNKIKYKIAKISSKPDLVVRNYRKKHFKKGKN